jgi:hypothetical protein
MTIRIDNLTNYQPNVPNIRRLVIATTVAEVDQRFSLERSNLDNIQFQLIYSRIDSYANAWASDMRRLRRVGSNSPLVAFDPYSNLPFRTDGAFGVVVLPNDELNVSYGGGLVFPTKVVGPQFQPVYNRILIPESFAKALDAGRVYYANEGGGKSVLTWSKVLGHEIAHRIDVFFDENGKFKFNTLQDERGNYTDESRDVVSSGVNLFNLFASPGEEALDQHPSYYYRSLDGKFVPVHGQLAETSAAIRDLLPLIPSQLPASSIYNPLRELIENFISPLDLGEIGSVFGSVLSRRITDDLTWTRSILQS